jgi:hypothetical protein
MPNPHDMVPNTTSPQNEFSSVDVNPLTIDNATITDLTSTVITTDLFNALISANLENVEFGLTTAVGSPFTFLLTAGVICGVNTATGPRAIVLETPSSGNPVKIVFDFAGNANVNNITITDDNGNDINGALSYVISTAYGSALLVWGGSSWFVVAKV